MKKKLQFLFFLSLLTSLVTQSNNAKSNNPENNIGIATIDFQDTVVFDMSNATTILNTVRIPVYINSDDTIYSLDFAFEYNQSNLSYDSVANQTNYIEAFSYYNSIDSTVRFTSNSTQEYAHDSDLVAVQFTMLNNNLYNSDLYNLTAYLNGDPCSVKIIGGLTLTTNDLKTNNVAINIYPNPVNDILHIECDKNSSVQIYNIKGDAVHTDVSFLNSRFEIDMKNLPAGNYVVKISGDDYIIPKKILKK